MTDSADPRWDLVHDPVAFFGLEGDFDRKQLKRAYKKLVLRFRPEEHPEEFQKIRTAYEALERELTYGIPRTPAPMPLRQLSMATRGSETTEPDRPWIDRIRETTPQALVEELQNKSHASEEELITLALLSDMQDTTCSKTYAGWLIHALERYPSSRAVQQLLRACCHGNEGKAQAETLVQQLADSRLSAWIYGWLSEPLWIHLVQTLTTREFDRLSKDCRARLRAPDLNALAILEINVLRAGVLCADFPWVEERRRWIEQNCYEIPEPAEYNLEAIDAMLRYRKFRDEYLTSGRAARQELDAVLVAWTRSDSFALDTTFQRWQRSVRAQGADWFLAMGPEDDTTHALAFEALGWVAWEVRSRIPSAAPPIDMLQESVQNLAYALQKRCRGKPSTPRSLEHLALIFVVILGTLGITIGFVRIMGLAEWSLWSGPVSFLGILLAIRPWSRSINRRFEVKCQRTVYRPELMRYLEETNHPLSNVLEIVQRSTGDEVIAKVVMRLQTDYALKIYAFAVC